MFTGILSSRTRGTVPEMLLVSATMILLLCVIEYIYMRVVKHSSDRYLLTLMQPREKNNLEGGAVVKRIAVVEDEVYMREELCNMLQRTGILRRQSPSLKMPLGSWQPSVLTL